MVIYIKHTIQLSNAFKNIKVMSKYFANIIIVTIKCIVNKIRVNVNA